MPNFSCGAVNLGNEKEHCQTSKMAYVASHLKKGITHQQRVMRLYRNSLKHLLSWCIDREIWREEVLILRDRFDTHKNEANQRKIQKILEAAEVEFESKKHPFPYVGKSIEVFNANSGRLMRLKRIAVIETKQNVLERLTLFCMYKYKVKAITFYFVDLPMLFFKIPRRPLKPGRQQMGEKLAPTSTCKLHCSSAVIWIVEW